MGTTKTGRRIHTQPHTGDWVGSTDVCMYTWQDAAGETSARIAWLAVRSVLVQHGSRSLPTRLVDCRIPRF